VLSDKELARRWIQLRELSIQGQGGAQKIRSLTEKWSKK